jgi:hypothetical protein
MARSSAFKFMGGATWLDLLATSGRTFGTDPVERLATPTDLQRWLEAVGLAPEGPVTEQDRVAAIGPASVELIEGAITRSSGSVRLAPPRVRTAGGALGLIARQAVLTLVGPERAMLKECAEHDCRWVFLDPGGRRRWCPEPACANRGRVRAHRARERQAAQPEGVASVNPGGGTGRSG